MVSKLRSCLVQSVEIIDVFVLNWLIEGVRNLIIITHNVRRYLLPEHKETFNEAELMNYLRTYPFQTIHTSKK